ncbi:MAG: DNA-directed RNA polymerase subunit beta' [Acidimicrobiia bacterium]|nr:DNA-directed RNA polymerase subunit beta' [Acidimicrobiia bacterium]
MFEQLEIGLATAEEVRAWSNGEVKKPETINYRTLKPEQDGLFCQRIFGPVKDWECACGKYKRVRFKGIICERCGVEVTRKSVRRERMGHIELAAPVTHIWYLKGVPSRLGYLLDVSPKDLERVIYFASYIVTSVNDEKRHEDLPELEARHRNEIDDLWAAFAEREQRYAEEAEAELAQLEEEGVDAREIENRRKALEKDIRRDTQRDRERVEEEQTHLDDVFDAFRGLKVRRLVESEFVWRDLVERYDDYFTGGMGAEAIRDLLHAIDLDVTEEDLRAEITASKGQKRTRAIKRLKVVAAFKNGENSPLGMILEAVPVIPPDLRPMVQLDGGRFATSDLNDLYRRVINRNNRLKRLLDLGAPEIIVNNEKRMLQEAVDALLDNGRRGRPVTGPGNRPLKSLSDMLKGKQGRFRQNLLGKRVDYSGRSVIVVGPSLKLHQCGLPKQMALELFKPFVMKRLVQLDLAANIKAAKRMVERSRPQVWDVLEEVISEHPVFLNRAPTLHRLGIQAFEPILVEGKAIQIHPLVCAAFNADFDGDQMAVHVPLSVEAQAEARILMLSAHNVLSPAHGRPLVTPTQDMVIGAYYLTEARTDLAGEGRVFASPQEAMMAFETRDGGGARTLDLHASIRVRGLKPEMNGDLVETTVGRVIFNTAFPESFAYVNRVVKKKDLAGLVTELAEEYTKAQLAETLDKLKALGFHYATVSGLTFSIDDVKVPGDKRQILDKYEKESEKVDKNHRKGLITEHERRQQLQEIWSKASDEVMRAMAEEMEADPFNSIQMMTGSGARGQMIQVRQIGAMRGLVSNPKGEVIPRPIKSNYREGLSVLEYFISTHGARKGLADTALRTADSGYLTRRLVDVAQEVIVREPDCETSRGLDMAIRYDADGDPTVDSRIDSRIFGRTAGEDVTGPDGTVIVPEGELVTRMALVDIVAARVASVKVRSPLLCQSRHGVCAKCYGMALGAGGFVEQGEAVGTIAAQSIGEPGTQLTMRTFHTGGIASAQDITQGLPRVQELFEARTPKGKAEIARIAGKVSVEEIPETRDRIVAITATDGTEEVYDLGGRQQLAVVDGQEVQPGDRITYGPFDPKELLEVKSSRAVQEYLVDEVQDVYTSQGVDLHDKHIELIVKQMMRKVTVQDTGESTFLPGERVDQRTFQETNRNLVQEGRQPADARQELMGITKASLATESWLSAASFQETTRVLTEAAIEGKSDTLLGLKENVIIGRLIPAGTGVTEHKMLEPSLPEGAQVVSVHPFFQGEGEAEMSAEDAAEFLRSIGKDEDPEEVSPEAG